MALTHGTEAHCIANRCKFRFAPSELKMIPSRVHYDFIARRSVNETHKHLPRRFNRIDLNELPGKISTGEFLL